MGENQHQSRSELSIFGNDQKNNVEEVLEPGTDCCIYRVPHYLRKINEAAYTPMLISIGPLHYGRKELMGMENQKKRFWSKFWERENNALKLEEFKIYIENQAQHIREHYSVSSLLQTPEYVAMIQRDAVFIIELFMRNFEITMKFLLESQSLRASMTTDHFEITNEFLLESPSLRASITTDLLLLENQVPYFVLNHLCTQAFPSSAGGNPSFFRLSLLFFNGVMEFNPLSLSEVEPQVKHFIDLVRCAFVKEVQRAESNGDRIYDLPSATKLNQSGLNFSVSEHKCYLDITLVKRKRGKWLPWFKVNELQIPQIKIFDETESLFRNMMALELFHYPTQTHIRSYTKLMDCLIDTVKDVDLLIEKGIIVNCVGDNEVIMKMFNTLGTNMIFGDSRYYDIVKRMEAHYQSPWNHVKAKLRSTYFSHVWKGTATVAATFLLILTVIQTVCSIMQL